MTKSERATMAALRSRAEKAEAQTASLDAVAALIWDRIKSDVEALVEESINAAVDDLQVSR